MFVCIHCDKAKVDWLDVAVAEVECDCCGHTRFCR
ncbi:unnamed protein product, partial [marine sediment metagenome]